MHEENRRGVDASLSVEARNIYARALEIFTGTIMPVVKKPFTLVYSSSLFLTPLDFTLNLK